MADKRFELTYGEETRTFTVPKDRLSGPLIAPRTPQALPGEARDILKKALQQPAGRPSLRELAPDRRVAVIVSDEFRAGLQHEILDVLLDEIVPAKPASVTVFCATGTHKPEVYAKNAASWVREAEARLGVKLEFVAHDSEKSDFADLGTTTRGTRLKVDRKLLECDLRVHGHESKPHYFYGYSCIDKQICPGLSWGETVAQNHKWALDPGSGPGRNAWHPNPERQDNPVSQDGREAREISERYVLSPGGEPVEGEVVTFGLDMVSAKPRVLWVRAGDPTMISQEMPPVVDRLMSFEVERSRYVIVSPGGPPASQALYGTQNSLDLALKGAVLEGGEALVIAPMEGRPDLPEEVRGLAPDERSKALFWDNLVRLLPRPLAEARKEIADHFELYLWKTDRVLRLLKEDRIGIAVYSQLPAEILKEGGFESAADIQGWIDERVSRGDGMFTVIDNGNKLCVTGKQPGADADA
jgi:nickel-dependent lactate racemase